MGLLASANWLILKMPRRKTLRNLTLALFLTVAGIQFFSYYQQRTKLLTAVKDMEDEHSDTREYKVHGDSGVATDFTGKVRILIWVMTSPNTLEKRAKIVRETWGRRADVLLFFSSTANDSFPVIGLNVSEGREHLVSKTIKAFLYIHKHHFNDADWFMKADDDTYVVVENLRYFLSEEDPQSPVYFGEYMKMRVMKHGFNSGGAGYILSKEALCRFGSRGANGKRWCRSDNGPEDTVMSKCLHDLGVRMYNSTDSKGRSRFHHYPPERYARESWRKREDMHHMSEYPISFHKVEPKQMVALEYLIYQMDIYGRSGRKDLNRHADKTIDPNKGPIEWLGL